MPLRYNCNGSIYESPTGDFVPYGEYKKLLDSYNALMTKVYSTDPAIQRDGEESFFATHDE